MKKPTKKPKTSRALREYNTLKKAAKIAKPFIDSLYPQRAVITRNIDQHDGKPAIADVTDPLAHVEIFVNGTRYRLKAKGDMLEVQICNTSCGLVVEPVASNVVLIGPAVKP